MPKAESSAKAGPHLNIRWASKTWNRLKYTLWFVQIFRKSSPQSILRPRKIFKPALHEEPTTKWERYATPSQSCLAQYFWGHCQLKLFHDFFQHFTTSDFLWIFSHFSMKRPKKQPCQLHSLAMLLHNQINISINSVDPQRFPLSGTNCLWFRSRLRRLKTKILPCALLRLEIRNRMFVIGTTGSRECLSESSLYTHRLQWTVEMTFNLTRRY